jgi:glycosyltransferase involved in cell wall biosynthesis
MRESNFDVVHAHGLRAGFLVRAAALAIRKPPQIVYSIHGLHFAYYRSFWPKLLLVLAERLLKRQTSLWLCASESDAANALKFRIAYPGRVHVVVNAVDALTFQEHADLGSDFRLELGMAAHEKLLTTVARLHRQKDLPTLLHAMRHVRSNINNVRLAIVGDGPETSKLRELCSQLALDRCVSFMGMRRDVPRILAATDIFLLATHWEATSIALLEAMAAGKPVIASNVDGVREVVVPEVTGILVQPENAGALAEAACRLLRDPALAQRMGQAGRQRVQQDFSPQKLWSRVEGFYLKSKI